MMRPDAKQAERVVRLTEAAWQQRVIELATWRGWLIYHTHDSRRSNPGFPDLVLARAGRLVVAELKAECGRVTAEQRRWLLTLASVPGIEVYLWRPSDWPAVQQSLSRTSVAAR